MVLKIKWLKPANLQVEKIASYIKSEAGTRAAYRVVRKIYARPGILAKSPFAGQREELLKDYSKEYRYLVEGNYKILYFVEENAIFISAVFDCRRAPESLRESVVEN